MSRTEACRIAFGIEAMAGITFAVVMFALGNTLPGIVSGALAVLSLALLFWVEKYTHDHDSAG